MDSLELHFPLLATGPIPADHGYVLYAAMSRLLPKLHTQNGIGVHPIVGRLVGDRRMSLTPDSTLQVRAPVDDVATLVRLAGRRLELSKRCLQVGVPRVQALAPATVLRSRIVTIKGFMDQDPFAQAVRRKLEGLSVSSDVNVKIGKRRTLRIRDKEIVGHEVVLEGLSPGDSLRVQENGDPGDPHMGFARRHMGCAMFAPFTGKEHVA